MRRDEEQHEVGTLLMAEEDPTASSHERTPSSEEAHNSSSSRCGILLRVLIALTALVVLAVYLWSAEADLFLRSFESSSNAPCPVLPSSPRAPRPGHIAICFFGQVKNFTAILPSLEEHVFAPLRAQNLSYECLAHTYNIEEITNSRNGEYHAPIHPDTLVALRRACGPEPVTLKFTDPQEVDQRKPFEEYFLRGNPWGQVSNMTQISFIRQLASLKFVTEMRQHRNEFEYALYLRPDTRFFTPLHFNTSITAHEVATPDFHAFAGLNDRMAYGRTRAMDVYGTRLDYIPTFWQRHPELNLLAEDYLKTVLEDHHLQAQVIHFRFARVRANGEMQAADVQLCAHETRSDGTGS